MDKLIAQFPKHIVDALDIASKSNYQTLENRGFENVVICGMGGSGIGGEMVKQLFAGQLKKPLILVKDYCLPAFVNDKTLVICSSYSGNTEETIAATKEAREKKATIVGVSSGGELLQFCKKNNYDFVKIPGGNPPRSMFAFSFIQLVNILASAKILDVDIQKLYGGSRSFLNNELILIKKNAQLLADFLYKKQGVLYSDAERAPVVIRARQQFNENSKQLVWHHIVPEMNHNELVGWEGGNEKYAVVIFESQFSSDRIKHRFELTKNIIQKKTNSVLSIEGKGENLFEEVFYFIHIVDWASIFLANLNNVDPFEIKSINYLKSELEKF